jgi:hypothetical protein
MTFTHAPALLRGACEGQHVAGPFNPCRSVCHGLIV